jgi:acetyl-CoA carboxylase carboxyl transferase subunit beta
MAFRDTIRRFWSSFTPKRKRQIVRSNGIDDRAFLQKKHACPVCGLHIEEQELVDNLYVCPCPVQHHFRVNALERVRYIADGGFIEEISASVDTLNPLEFPGYEEKVEEAKRKSGLEEAIHTGTCRIDGYEVVLCVMSFQFMGGSMGSVVGEKIARAMLYAANQGMPVILFTASGGARMQEGIFSLMQMAKTSHAIGLLEQAGQPFFVVLTDPTTGGVTASFAMLGDVTLAEPGALIGFAGPRVIEGTIKQKLPDGFQRAEFLEEKGFVDAIVPRKDLKRKLSFLLRSHGAKKVERR